MTHIDQWRTVFHIGAGGLLAVIIGASVLFIEGIEPVLFVFFIVLAVALYLSIRGPRWGHTSLFVAVVLFSLANLPFTIPSLVALKSTAEFIFAVLFVISAVNAIVGGLHVLRHHSSTDAAGSFVWSSLGLFLLLSALAVAIRIMSPEVTPLSGDLRVTAENITFDPATLQAEPGEIGVFIDNKDLVTHTFTIEELNVDVSIPGASSERVTFRARAGTYTFRCTISGHETMTGVIAVRPD